MTPKDKQTTDLQKWLEDSFKSFLDEDPTRVTGASCVAAANYVMVRVLGFVDAREAEAYRRGQLAAVDRIIQTELGTKTNDFDTLYDKLRAYKAELSQPLNKKESES